MDVLSSFLFIYIYFKYIHVPTINQVFSFILWLDHHSVSFLLLAPIMGLSWSFGPRQLKTILLLLGVKNHTFNPGVLLLQLLLLWLLPPHILVPVLLHYSNQCSGFVSISFLNPIPQGEIKSLISHRFREQVPVCGSTFITWSPFTASLSW